MGFLIDTNILSELQKGGRADIGVKTWYDNCDPDDFFLSVLVVGEIRQGIERLRRRDPIQAERLEHRLDDVRSMILKPQLAGAQPFDTPAMRAAQGERTSHQFGECYKKPFVLSQVSPAFAWQGVSSEQIFMPFGCCLTIF